MELLHIIIKLTLQAFSQRESNFSETLMHVFTSWHSFIKQEICFYGTFMEQLRQNEFA